MLGMTKFWYDKGSVLRKFLATKIRDYEGPVQQMFGTIKGPVQPKLGMTKVRYEKDAVLQKFGTTKIRDYEGPVQQRFGTTKIWDYKGLEVW